MPVQASTQVLFSGAPRVSLETPGLGLGQYPYTVDDPNGNPLAEGTSITVTVDGENIAVQGQAAVTLADHLMPGSGRTQFRFAIVSTGTAESPPSVSQIQIAVTGPNGSVTAFRPGGLRPGASVTGRGPAARR